MSRDSRGHVMKGSSMPTKSQDRRKVRLSRALGIALTPKAAKQMREALVKVTQQGGTATRAAVEGFLVGGKTGTVKKHNPKGGYYANAKITSFCGMMPALDPAFVCVVVIDDPRPPASAGIRAQGGYVAAPVFKRIATRVAAHMNLQPTEPVHTSLAVSKR